MSYPVVQIGDVKDAYGFVQRCIIKSKIKASGDQYEELVCEAMVLLCALHKRYDPAKDRGSEKPRAGGGTEASFAGYASYLLPLKIRKAWHRMNPTHVMTTQPDGTRKYVYHQPPKSLHERGDGRDRELMDTLDEQKMRTPGEFVSVPTTA